jgi:LPXTG-motif cell wall-anchored protein
MRNTLAIGATAAALLFGGAGVANATVLLEPASTTTTVLAQDVEHEDGDNTGLWGLAGLLGLLGLAGLKRRKDADYPATRATGTVNPPPRA